MTTTKPPDATLQVVGYVRVSTQGQVESGAGLRSQRKQIRDACEQRGWTLVRIESDEGASASSTKNRPGLAAALAAVESGEAGGLIVAKLDRLSRSVRDFCDVLDRSQRQEWVLACLDLGLDTSTATGRFTGQIIACVAELERSLIGQRTREGLAQKRAEGVHLGRKYSISPKLARRIRAMRAGGATLEAICATLNAEGVPTSRGGAEWRPSSIQRALRPVPKP